MQLRPPPPPFVVVVVVVVVVGAKLLVGPLVSPPPDPSDFQSNSRTLQNIINNDAISVSCTSTASVVSQSKTGKEQIDSVINITKFVIVLYVI